jgi:hypothetical protein
MLVSASICSVAGAWIPLCNKGFNHLLSWPTTLFGAHIALQPRGPPYSYSRCPEGGTSEDLSVQRGLCAGGFGQYQGYPSLSRMSPWSVPSTALALGQGFAFIFRSVATDSDSPLPDLRCTGLVSQAWERSLSLYSKPFHISQSQLFRTRV